jgi:DNA-binding transcriptional regulator YdaS (Cro superfamily)
MTLTDFFTKKEHGAKSEMAAALGISRTWLSQIINGSRLPSPALSIDIEKYTKGKVSRKVLRQDIFGI